MAIRRPTIVTSIEMARAAVRAPEVLLEQDGAYRRLVRHENMIDRVRDREARRLLYETFRDQHPTVGGLVEDTAVIDGPVIIGSRGVVLGNSYITTSHDNVTGRFTLVSSGAVVVDSVIVGSIIKPKSQLTIQSAGLIHTGLYATGDIIGTEQSPVIAFSNTVRPTAGALAMLMREAQLPEGASRVEKARILTDFVSARIRHTDESNRYAAEIYGNGVLDSCDAAIKRGSGVCAHQALILKEMMAEAGLNPEFFAGIYVPLGSPHVWIEVTVDWQRYIADKRGLRSYEKAAHDYADGCSFGGII